MAMKIQKKKNTKEILILALLVSVGLLILVSGSVYAYIRLNQPDTTSTPTKSESDEQQSDAIDNTPPVKETTPNTDTPEPAKTDAETGKKVAEMVASANISGGTVYIRGGINNLVVYDGTCSAQLIGPNGELLTKNTTLLQNAATTDCKTISINTSDLAKGKWKFTLDYNSASAEGKSNENTFTIQ